MDFGRIGNILRGGIHYPWLLLSVFLGIFSHVLRAMRWRLLVDMLGVKSSVKMLTNAVFINYGANLLLPRLGEVARCAYVSKKTGITFPKVFGTLVSERLVDMFLVALLVVTGFIAFSDLFNSFFAQNILWRFTSASERATPLFYGGIALLALLLAGLSVYLYHTRWGLKVRLLLHEIWIGIKTLLLIPHKAQFLLLSLSIWGAYMIQLYVCFFAFDFTCSLSLGVALALFVMSSVAFGIPVQGGIGPWHFMIISTLIYYGIERTDAAAFALIVHTLQTAVNGATGVYAFFSSGKSNSKQ